MPANESGEHALHTARLRTQMSSNPRAFFSEAGTPPPEKRDSRLFYK